MNELDPKVTYDLDETFDGLVCRPLGKLVARWFMRTTVTANQVSGMAAMCGLFAGCAYAAPWPFPAYGAVLMFTMMVLDCADGEVARQRGGGGWRGRILDGMADLVTAIAIHLGMLVHLILAGTNVYGYELSGIELFFIALAAGLSMTWRCGVVDDIKQRLKVNSIDRALQDHADEPKTLWDRFLYWTLKSYIDGIRKYSGKRRPGGYLAFRRAQVVGPTHHHLAMVLAGFLAQYSPHVAFLGFFFISVVPANLYMLGVLSLAPKLSAEESSVRQAVT